MDMQVGVSLNLDNRTFLSWFTESVSVLITPKEEIANSVKISTMTLNGSPQWEKNKMPVRGVTATIMLQSVSSITLSSRHREE
jgi:hypothetical protein